MKIRMPAFLFMLFAAMLLTACGSQSPIRRVGRLDTGTGYRVFVQGDYAFVTNNDGVVIVDIHQPSKPKQAALIELGESAHGVYAQGDLLYFGSGVGFGIADISDPYNPRVLGMLPIGVANQICMQDGIVYAALYSGKLAAIDVHDPAAPVVLGEYSASGMGLGVGCAGDIVYYGTSAGSGMEVIDVSDPAAPVGVMTVANTLGARSMQILGDLMLLGCHGNGARILDISNPRAPIVLDAFSRSGEAWGVGGDSSIIWVGDLQEGVKLYRLTQSQSAQQIAVNPRYAPHDVFCDGRYAYLADQDKGFVVLEYAP